MASLTTLKAFPKPDIFSDEVKVGSSPCWLKMTVALFAIFLVGRTILLAAEIPGQLGSLELSARIVAAIVVSMLLHEILHLFAHPGFGLNPQSRFGVGRVGKKPAVWVGYADWVSKERAVIVLILPFFVLAVVFPVTSFFVDPSMGSLFASMGAANFLSSHNDLNTALAVKRSPAGAVFEAESGFYVK